MMQRRSGFTLVEILLSMGIIGTLSSIIIAAMNPAAQFTAARDVQRRVMQREIRNAVQNYVITRGTYPGDKTIPAGADTAMPVCRYQAEDIATCISLDVLVDEGYITALPIDPVETDEDLTGYEVYVEEGQVQVHVPYLGQSQQDISSSESSSSADPSSTHWGEGEE